MAADPSIEQVLLKGAGPNFCSGGDLDEFGTGPGPVASHLIRTTRSPALRLAGVADRVTAQLHGACVGAGIEIPALAGRVVATPDTRVRLPEVEMGLIPGAGRHGQPAASHRSAPDGLARAQRSLARRGDRTGLGPVRRGALTVDEDGIGRSPEGVPGQRCAQDGSSFNYV